MVHSRYCCCIEKKRDFLSKTYSKNTHPLMCIAVVLSNLCHAYGLHSELFRRPFLALSIHMHTTSSTSCRRLRMTFQFPIACEFATRWFIHFFRRISTGVLLRYITTIGNFAVVGRHKSLFPGALISPKSLFCFTPIACNFEVCAAHRRSCSSSTCKTPRAQQHTSLLVPRARG